MSTPTSAFKLSYGPCTKWLLNSNNFTYKLMYFLVDDYYVCQYGHIWEFTHGYGINCFSFISPLHRDRNFFYFLNKVYRKFSLAMNFNVKIVRVILKIIWSKRVTGSIIVKNPGLELFSFSYQKITIFSSTDTITKTFLSEGLKRNRMGKTLDKFLHPYCLLTFYCQ